MGSEMCIRDSSSVGLFGAIGLIVGAGAIGYKFGQWLYNIAGAIPGLQEQFDKLGRSIFEVARGLGLIKSDESVGVNWDRMKFGEARSQEDFQKKFAENRARIAAGVPAMAAGGYVNRGGLALVGERGPELVNLPRGSRVHSASESRSMASGGNTNINISMGSVVVREQADIARIARELGRRIDSRLVARGMRPVTA